MAMRINGEREKSRRRDEEMRDARRCETYTFTWSPRMRREKGKGERGLNERERWTDRETEREGGIDLRHTTRRGEEREREREREKERDTLTVSRGGAG